MPGKPTAMPLMVALCDSYAAGVQAIAAALWCSGPQMASGLDWEAARQDPERVVERHSIERAAAILYGMAQGSKFELIRLLLRN